MYKLHDLYAAVDTLNEMGLSTDNMEQELNRLEEELIKNEIIPALESAIEPALKPVKRELVLIVDYVPDMPLNVKLSRRKNFASEIPDAKELTIDSEVKHAIHAVPYKSTGGKSKAFILRVKFPDGTVIEEKNATDTCIKCIKKIGVERVRKVVIEHHLVFCNVPVISNRRDSKYGSSQRDLGGGWLLMTCTPNPRKKKFLDKVSKVLGLGLKTEIL